MGESGSGKTTAMRNLDPKSTFVIDCDKKGLSWKGWKAQYNTDNKNYFCNNEPEKVILMLKRIAKDFSHIKVAVIDTINGIMIGDEMRRSKEKGYDKWADLAGCIWDLLDIALTLRDDLTVIFTAHTQTERDDSGFYFTRIKTSGRKLDKIVLESKFTTVLLSKCVNDQYVFETSSNNSTAKTPMGAFAEKEIPNDIVEVLKALEEF
jgi:hypothetical protein